MNAIKTINLEHVYKDGTVALSGVNFEANAGEKVAVLGPNGSGKTTLFYHFNGLVKPTCGEVKVFGENIGKDNMDEIRRCVGLVFQDADSQLFAPTVFEDIAFGPRNIGLSREEIKSRVSHIMRRFDIEELAKKNPANLSGGQKKRVAIAGVAAMEPEVLVLDEPTSGMDAGGISNTMELLEELNGEGKTIIISTHDSDLAASWADRVYVLNEGRVFTSGSPKKIFADENLAAEAGLKHPVIVQTYREFKARGILKGEVPFTVLDFMECADVMDIRCAVAGCDVNAGEQVFLGMREGMLFADKDSRGIRGIAVFGGKKGEDIAVKDVNGDLRQLAGNITIVRVPGIVEGGSRAADFQKVQEILDRSRIQRTGAMGTSAKVLMNKIGLGCDIEFDVIQSGILAAMRGFNVCIFASGGMADRAVEKVKEKKLDCSFFML